MENHFRVREEFAADWRKRLGDEAYEALAKKGVDIEDVVAFARKWDMALQAVLDQIEEKDPSSKK